MKNFGEIAQNQLLFVGSGIMKNSADRNKKLLILNPNFSHIYFIFAKKSITEIAC